MLVVETRGVTLRILGSNRLLWTTIHVGMHVILRCSSSWQEDWIVRGTRQHGRHVNHFSAGYHGDKSSLWPSERELLPKMTLWNANLSKSMQPAHTREQHRIKDIVSHCGGLILLLKRLELWCLCCMMMFRWINKQPGIQKFWNLCSHHQEIYDWISPLNKPSGLCFILTQQSRGGGGRWV